MPSVSDVVIADRLSDANQVRFLGTTGLAVSWELSRPGALAFDIPLVDLIRYGFANPLDLVSKWVHYEHPSAGHWGGIVTNVTCSDGIVSVSAESWAAALRGVGTRAFGGASYGVVSTLMQQIDTVRPITGISRGTIDVGGGDVVVRDETVEQGTDILESYLPGVLDRWQAERGWKSGLQAAGWNVHPVTRRLSFDGTYGVDRSASVWIHAGRHIVSNEVSDDTTDIVNTAYYSGEVNYRWTERIPSRDKKGKKRVKRVTHVGVRQALRVGVNAASVARYGEKGAQFREDFPSDTLMQQAANSRAQFMALNSQNVTIDTADVDGLWSKFSEGDLVTAALGFDGLIGKMVVRMRSLNVETGVMTVAGEATLGTVLA